jgi:hypothetical protein
MFNLIWSLWKAVNKIDQNGSGEISTNIYTTYVQSKNKFWDYNTDIKIKLLIVGFTSQNLTATMKIN